MIVPSPENYRFHGFEVSHTKNKKYDAILLNKLTKKFLRVPFGDKRYEQYHDKALGVYSSLDHHDEKRRAAYRKRHDGEQLRTYSSGFFSYYFLW